MSTRGEQTQPSSACSQCLFLPLCWESPGTGTGPGGWRRWGWIPKRGAKEQSLASQEPGRFNPCIISGDLIDAECATAI